MTSTHAGRDSRRRTRFGLWLALCGWAILCALAHAGARGFGWHYFVTGARVLDSGHLLDLYADHSQLQSGPLSFVAVLPLVTLLPAKAAEGTGIALMTVAGVVQVWLVEKIIDRRRPSSQVLVTGAIVIAVSAEVAVHWAHPDDVLALVGVFTALFLLRRERSVWAAVALALAVDCKPWALLFAPMLLLAARPDRLRVAGAFLAVVLAAWLPFYLGNPETMHAVQFRIPVSSSSVLHLFGVSGGTPSWCRPAQLALGAVAVWVAVRRHRWHAIVLVGICARMLLDPATKNYYESGLVAASALYDLVALEALAPVMTLAAVSFVYLPSYVMTGLPTERAVLRLIFLLAAPCVVLTVPRSGTMTWFSRARPSAPTRRRSGAPTQPASR